MTQCWHRKETTGSPSDGSKEKREERTNYQLQENNVWLSAKGTAQDVNYKLEAPKSSKYKNLNI